MYSYTKLDTPSCEGSALLSCIEQITARDDYNRIKDYFCYIAVHQQLKYTQPCVSFTYWLYPSHIWLYP